VLLRVRGHNYDKAREKQKQWSQKTRHIRFISQSAFHSARTPSAEALALFSKNRLH
jgi:hypothetical protein